ncbi:MAG: hypothetical protein FWF72_05730 [Paludibacter sp.]|nr:hypothetical protein [Paludibacter sp.]
MTVANNIKLLLLGNLARNTLNSGCLSSHLAIFNNISSVKFYDILLVRFIKNMRFLFKNVHGKLAMAFLALSVLQLFGFNVQAQTHTANASQGGMTVFVGDNSVISNSSAIKGNFSFVYSKEKKTAGADMKSDRAVAQNPENQNFDMPQTLGTNVSKNEETVFIGDNSIISNAALIKGDFSFVYARERKTESTDIKSDRTLAQNSDYQQTTPEKSGAKIKKTYKEAVYSPISPFGDAAFTNGGMAGSAVLPVQSNISHKLFCIEFAQRLFTPVFDYTSKYFTNNNFILQVSGSFACAYGNLPPPSKN